MLDVHPPEHTPHTWRDFLIHIATICVGLLIAIGLEQTVEYLHHRHELREFREGMVRDGQKAMQDATGMEAVETMQEAWLLQRLQQVTAAVAQHQPVPNLPPPQLPLYDYPVDPTWNAARNSGLLALVPQDEVKSYSEVDNIIDNAYGFWKDSLLASGQRRAFEVQFNGSFISASNALPHATPADLAEYQRLLRNELASTASVRNEIRYLLGAETAILHGARSLDEIEQEEKKVAGTYDD